MQPLKVAVLIALGQLYTTSFSDTNDKNTCLVALKCISKIPFPSHWLKNLMNSCLKEISLITMATDCPIWLQLVQKLYDAKKAV